MEIQPQPKVTVPEQQQPEEEQVVTTTTQVEEQVLPQVTADASSTQPKEQVSDIYLAVKFCLL